MSAATLNLQNENEVEEGNGIWQSPELFPLLSVYISKSVFHPFYNNTELKLAFQRNLLGQITAAQAKLVYNENEIADGYTLIKTGAISDSQIPWLALLIVVIIPAVLVFVVLRRRAGYKV